MNVKFFFMISVVLFLETVAVTAEKMPEKPPPAIQALPVDINEPATPPPTGETPVKAKREPIRPLDQMGRVEKVDAEKGTFILDGKTFSAPKSGRVLMDGISKSFSDLKEGDLVAVVYFAKADGTNSVIRITRPTTLKTKNRSSKAG